MKLTLLCCALILAYSFRAFGQDAGIDDEVTARKAAQLRAAQRDFAESQIVRPQTGEMSPDARRIYEQPNSGRFLASCYRGQHLDQCRGFAIGVASLILGSSKSICLGDHTLTVPKLVRILITWHQDNPHLWDFTTLGEQIELALAEQYPCPKARKRP